MAAALDELQRRGFFVDRMSPLDILETMTQVAGAHIPESEDWEKAAARWLASLRETADE
jgi:hypothetical protein